MSGSWLLNEAKLVTELRVEILITDGHPSSPNGVTTVGYVGESSGIPRVVTSGGEVGGRNQREMGPGRGSDPTQLAQKVEEGLISHSTWKLLEAGKRKGTDTFLGTPEGTSPAVALI